LFSTGAVASTVFWTVTGSFMVPWFMSSDGGYLGEPVVNPHEVGIFSELGDDFARADPLSVTCYPGDRHKALLGSGVHPVGYLIQGLVEVPDGKSLSEMSVAFVPLLVAVTLGILVISGLICGSVVANSSSEMSSWYQSGQVSKGPVSLAAMKTWRSGVLRSESVVATAIDVCSLVGASGVPSRKGSDLR
jgi:hypothetical protein